jgi:hypothetical protein
MPNTDLAKTTENDINVHSVVVIANVVPVDVNARSKRNVKLLALEST